MQVQNYGKKQLIENFISGINDVDDVMDEWHSYVCKTTEKQDLDTIITEERLNQKILKFMANAFRDLRNENSRNRY